MFILHHYPESPYAEKTRVMLGYTGLAWQSVDVPPQPPRPSLDPLLGGYRRIPVLQDGADIYCDTRLIGAQIAARSNHPTLAYENADSDAQAFIDSAEGDVFFASILAAPKGKMLVNMLRKRGLGIIKFMVDRAGAAGDGIGDVTPKNAKQIWTQHLGQLEARLGDKQFLGGLTPDSQDFAAYHTVWINSILAGGKIGAADSALVHWRDRMTAFGHGAPAPLGVDEALSIAAAHDPAPIAPEHTSSGDEVAIAPDDYMRDATMGRLVGETDVKWIIARDTDAHGLIHVHFPKAGYVIA
ncbi:MAG: glutathione S-transferase [Alphaproteobacteria bacterium]